MSKSKLSCLVGLKMKETRKAIGKTQQEIADSLRITKQAISNYESGGNIPNLEILLKFGDLYNCSMDYLLGRVDKPSGIFLGDTISLCKKSSKEEFNKKKEHFIKDLRRVINKYRIND